MPRPPHEQVSEMSRDPRTSASHSSMLPRGCCRDWVARDPLGQRVMQKTELFVRACSVAVPLQPLVKRVAAIQHCFKIERLSSRDCSLLVMERGKSTDQTNWEGGEDGGVAAPLPRRLNNEHYKLLK